MTTTQLLRKIGVNSFNEIQAKHIPQIAQLATKLSPEQLSILYANVSLYADSIKELIIDYKDLARKNIEFGSDIMKHQYAMSEKLADSMLHRIDEGDLSNDEIDYIFSQIRELKDEDYHRGIDIHEKNEKHTNRIWCAISTLVGIVLGCVSAMIFQSNNSNSDSEGSTSDSTSDSSSSSE